MARRFEFNENQQTALFNNGSYTYMTFISNVGFIKSTSVQRVSSKNPYLVYGDIDLEVDNVIEFSKAILGGTTYIFTAVDSVEYCFARLTETLGSSSLIGKISGVTETPVSIASEAYGGNVYVYLLYTGTSSSFIEKWDGINETLEDTFYLDASGDIITGAKHMDIDDETTDTTGANLWIVTYTNPSKLIKFNTNTGTYQSWDIA